MCINNLFRYFLFYLTPFRNLLILRCAKNNQKKEK